MQTYFKIGGLVLVFVLAGFSCINITVNGVDVPVSDLYEDHNYNDLSEYFDDGEESDVSVYGNANGYSFEYDNSLTVWTELDVTTETVIESDETEDEVYVSEVKPLLFQGETNKLHFRVVETASTPSDWALLNVEEYLAARDINNTYGNIFSFLNTTVQGNDALDIYGEATIASDYRILIIDLGESLLVIRQGMADERFDAIFDSLTIE